MKTELIQDPKMQRQGALALLQRKMVTINRVLATEVDLFRKMYFPHYHLVAGAPFHQEIACVLQEAAVKRGQKIAIAAPRDSAKSTLVTLQYVLWSICYRKDPFIVIISRTSSQAVGFLDAIKRELRENRLLARDFPEVCETGRKPLPPRWTREEICTRNDVKVLALGTGQELRGQRKDQFRPSLIILDDIETEDTASSSDQQQKLYDWVTKSVFKAGPVDANIICVGTIHRYNSLLARFTSPDEHPGWVKKIYRAVISWATHQELWESWSRLYNKQDEYEGLSGPLAARKYFEAHEAEMLEGAEVLWPAKRSYYALMELREKEGHYSFDSEYQNDPVNPRECHFNIKDIHFWDDRFQDEAQLLSSLQGQCEFYGACDPSMGRAKRNGDFSAIVIVVRHSGTGIVYVLDADIALRLPDRTIDDILSYGRIRSLFRFAFEENQFQGFMKDELEKRAAAQGVYMPVEGITHTGDKKARIESLQPLIKSGTIQFSRRHRILLEQMKQFPKGAHDDGIDALEMAARVAIDGCVPRITFIC